MDLPCTVCVGVRSEDPSEIIAMLEGQPRFTDGTPFFAAWTVSLADAPALSSVASVRGTGATPWVRAVFHAPAPLAEHSAELEAELERLATLVRRSDGNLYIQAVWLPEVGEVEPREHAFLIKKAAVTVTGASDRAAFVVGPLVADPDEIRTLYLEEVAAYIDLVALAPGGELRSAVAVLAELDPGKSLVLDGERWPTQSAETVTLAAEAASIGVAVILFDVASAAAPDLTPLQVLASELRGDLVFDRHAVLGVDGRAWSFVREDLDLRVVAAAPPNTPALELVFTDPRLRAPTLVDLAGGDDRRLDDTTRGADGLEVRVDNPGEVVLLRLERPSADELAGFDDVVDVSGDRGMPVEEILRRLQAFEDDQARRLDHYLATRSLHLRFQGLQGAFEVSYSGEFFNRGDEGFDWVWQDFFVGGVRWRSKKLPKVPLIQPEKVASLPAEIRLTKDYEYRLRGTAEVDGRDCWVVDFKPITATPGRSLYRGTVWVDREVFARVRIRATQVGLEGSVLSNEETFFFTPIDETGRPAPWSTESYILPLRISGQQTFSILSATLPVEVETVLEDVRINSEDFDRRREVALASDATMLRDTSEGLRYLKRDDSGGRRVEAELDPDRLFVLGGVFWDESVEYPLPLAGVNYLDLDLKDTGAQVDVFFAGAFLAAGIADPQLFGGRWNGGANVDGLFFKAREELYRDGENIPEEEVRRRSASADFFVGRPLARFLSFELTYGLNKDDYSRADDTADDFILPRDTLTHSLRAGMQYNRAGYRLWLSGAASRRSEWEYWGLPGNVDFTPEQKDFLKWRASFSKTWWLPKFRRVALSLEHLDGSNLDRFSGYDFGIFGSSSVSGYPSGLVRAEKANGVHLAAGINYFDTIRFNLTTDAMWASNAMTGLDNELLAGIGLDGTLTLPWQLIMNFEAGFAVAGPGKGGIALRVFFLRLFPGS